MKTRLLLLFVCVLGIQTVDLKGNPLPSPYPKMISELYFDEEGKWSVELDWSYIHNRYYSYSLEIGSKSKKTKVLSKYDDSLGDFFVITEADLASPLSIDLVGDSIYIEIYKDGEGVYSYLDLRLCFGNHPGATVESPKQGQSVALIEGWLKEIGGVYSLCDKPTIGTENKEEGVFGTIKGKVFDVYGKPLRNKELNLAVSEYEEEAWQDFYYGCSKRFTTNDEGEFTADVLARKYAKDLFMQTDEWKIYYVLRDLDDVLNLFPEDTIYCDFHIVGSINLDLEEDQQTTELFKVFPNPIKEDRILNYETSLPINAMGIEVEIHSLEGGMLLKETVSESKGTIDLSSFEKGGIYVVNFVGKGKNLYSTKIILE